MAHVYGPKIAAHPKMELACIFNPNPSSPSLHEAAAAYGGRAVSDIDAALAEADAVVIATPTNTHLEYISRCAEAGKPIYCEKPLDQSLDRVEGCLEALKAHPVSFMLGFNRRFDPDNAQVRKAVEGGELGALTFLMSWSREPAPPPIDYVRASGGYFVDATIHDIDLLCWIAGERPETVFAAGSNLFDLAIGQEGDVDATMSTMVMPSGALVHINNSRACSYGFDQRLEVMGRKGMVQTRNHRDDTLIRWGADRTEAGAPLKHFFLERYDASFGIALDTFYRDVMEGRPPEPTAEDGKAALAIALALDESRRTGRAVAPTY